MSELRVTISRLKSSLVENDSKPSQSAVDLVSQKDIYFCLERQNADISFSYDKLLARLCVYHKSTKTSKLEAITSAYKLGYLDCTNESAPLYAIGDENIKMLWPDLFSMQSEQVNTANMEEAEEQVAKVVVVENDGADEGIVDDTVVDVIKEANENTKSVADHVDVEEVADHRSFADIQEQIMTPFFFKFLQHAIALI